MIAATLSHQTIAIPVSDGSAVGHARRLAAILGTKVGMGPVESGELAIIVTEAGTNLVQHAGGGELLLHPVVGGRGGVDVLAIDKGPGMEDVGRCLEDGYSTGGSRGVGLGSIARIADRFDVYSRKDVGTVLHARMYAPARPDDVDAHVECGVVCVALPDEVVTGDGWALTSDEDTIKLLVVDGLGHGPLASEAALTAMRAFDVDGRGDAVAVLDRIHGALGGTRGAAGMVVVVDRRTRMLQIAGVGNIAGTVVGAERSRGLVSHNGILGQGRPRIQGLTQAFAHGDTLVVHSDGLSSRWSLDAYPGLAGRHPTLIAGVLFGDHSRRRDDATIVVLREESR